MFRYWWLPLAIFFIWLALLASSHAQIATLLPNGQQQFLDSNGAPLASGTVTFYIPTTTTFKDTWTDPDEANLNTNPIVLDAAGRATIYGVGQYRQILKDVAGNLIWDKLTAAPLGSAPGPVIGTQLAVADTAALVAADLTNVPVGSVVVVNTYNVANGQNAPPVAYYLTQTVCTVDNGSCFRSTADLSFYWHITPQTIWDVRWWGAYEDVQRSKPVVTVNSGVCTVAVTGGTFTAADALKNIVITDQVASAANGPTYAGTIVTGAGGGVTVSPCPTFSTALAQYVIYGHDDAGAWNNAIAYVGSLQTNGAITGKPILSGAGLTSGIASAPVIWNTNISPNNIGMAALASANFPLPAAGTAPTTGMFVFGPGGTFSAGENITLNGSFLPINVAFGANGSNGTIDWEHVTIKDWLGSSATPLVLTGVTTDTQSTYTGSISGCSGSAPYICTLTITAFGSGNPIQPGQAVRGVGIPGATYVTDFGPIATTGSGGVGTYTVENITSDPSVSSQTIGFLGLDLNVTNGSVADIGLVSRGNTCIADRSVIVAYSANKITLNKAPRCIFTTPTTMNVYQDSNGLYMSQNSGLHFNFIQVSESDFNTLPANQYGSALFNNAFGGSEFNEFNFSSGVVPIFLGPSSAGNTFRAGVTFQNMSDETALEFNPPSVILSDSHGSTEFYEYQNTGQIQDFSVTTARPQTVNNWGRAIIDTGVAYFAPNNIQWFYTEQSASAQNVTIGPFGFPAQGIGAVIFTTGAGGSWAEYTPADISIFSAGRNTLLPAQANQPLLIPGGIKLATSPLLQAETMRFPLLGTGANAYTFKEADSMGFFTSSAGSAATWTVPNNLNPSNGQVWWAFLENDNGAVPITLKAGSGTTVTQSGSTISGAGVTLTAQFVYFLMCPVNPTGTTASCFLSRLP